jgi:hypothetical protein
VSPDPIEIPSYEDFVRYFATGVLDRIPTFWDLIAPFSGDITTFDTESWNFLNDIAGVNLINEQQTQDFESFQHGHDIEFSTSVLSMPPKMRSENVKDKQKQTNTCYQYRTFSLSRATAFGRLDIIAQTKFLGPGQGVSSTRRLGCDAIQDRIEAKAILTPFKSSSPIPQMVFYVSEEAVNGFNNLSMPTLSFRPSRADDSHVLEAAKYGNPHDLALMIENGLASLNDCNTKGRSLLNVWTANFYFILLKCR